MPDSQYAAAGDESAVKTWGINIMYNTRDSGFVKKIMCENILVEKNTVFLGLVHSVMNTSL